MEVIGRLNLNGVKGRILQLEEGDADHDWLFLPLTEDAEIYAFNSAEFDNIISNG